MNYLKRAITSIKRNPGKNITLLLLLFVLGNLIAGAISIRQAVINTEANLRAQLPAVVTIDADHEAFIEYYHRTGEELIWSESLERITPELVNEIANLNYVRDYNFSLETSVVTRGLQRVFIPSINLEEVSEQNLQNIINETTPLRDVEFERFNLHGVQRSNMPDIVAGAISIASGQVFTQQQLDNGEAVALVSSVFANENNLQVGSVFDLTSIIFDSRDLMEKYPTTYHMMVENVEFIHLVETWELTVAGIFEIEQEFDYVNDPWLASFFDLELQNRIYLPNALINEISTFTLYGNLEVNPSIPQEWTIENTVRPAAFFALEDSRYLSSFMEASQELLPEFWMMVDLSNNFHSISASMDTMLWIADHVLYVSIGATIIIISLLITLFLRDRRHEIGIYLALGEKKGKVVSQILLEVLSVSAVSITLAVFSGNLISNGISKQMLENGIIQQQQDDTMDFNLNTHIPFDLQIFNPGKMSVEEMLAAYDTSLDGTTIAIFFAVGFGTILISTAVPITYILRLNPKKIMM